MGVTYQRLLSPGSQRPRGGGSRARAWVLLRWAAVRLAGCAARRRYWCGGARARRLAWPGLCGRGGRARSSGAAAGAGAVGYDSASYARNFDDGAWKAEEGVSWAGAGAPLPRAGASDAMASSDSVPSSAHQLTDGCL